MRINIGFKAIFFEKAIRKRQYTVNHIELGVGSELEWGVRSCENRRTLKHLLECQS